MRQNFNFNLKRPVKRWDTMCPPLSCTHCGRKQRSHRVLPADSLSYHSVCVSRRLSSAAVIADFHARRLSCLRTWRNRPYIDTVVHARTDGLVAAGVILWTRRSPEHQIAACKSLSTPHTEVMAVRRRGPPNVHDRRVRLFVFFECLQPSTRQPAAYGCFSFEC